ncbi:MAG: substrate-binding domain-containing protein [Opitutales bacterium]|nr:substrate-binding domain-containing protein [Opitutales bacterium]
MNPSAPPLSSSLVLPKRQTLVESVVDVLIAQINSGRWVDYLPGERILCHELQVSRPTLRQALKTLEREGRITGEHGKKRRITNDGDADTDNVSNKTIALLSPLHLDALPPFVLFWIDELRSHLAKVGQHLEFHTSSACAAQHPERALEGIVQSNPANLWILLLSSYNVQRWFCEHRIPALITGSCAPDVRLPSIDVDYRAACRHAAGVFHQRGHQQLALIIPAEGLAGDAESEAGFLEGCKNGTAPLIIRHDGTREHLIRKLEAAFRQKTPPNGFLVARAGHALTVISYLMQRGARIPQECAVISRDDEPFLDFMTPTMARYNTDRVAFARRLSRTVLQMVRAKSLPPHPIRLIPNLVDGGTV